MCLWTGAGRPGMIDPVISDDELASIDKPELLALVQSLRDELVFKQKVIDKITHEMAVLKRLKFAATSDHGSGFWPGHSSRTAVVSRIANQYAG